MARQQFRKPSRGSYDSGKIYDDGGGVLPQTPGKADHSETDRILGNIDDALGESSPEQTSPASTGELRDAEAGGGEISKTKGDDKENSKLNDKAGEDDTVGKGFRGDDNGKNSRLRSTLNSVGRRRALIGGGIVGTLVAVIVTIFTMLLPLKVVSIVENLQSRFFATSEAAVEKQTEKLFNRYAKKYLIPSLRDIGSCRSTRVTNKDCVPDVKGEGPAARLFRTWRDARLENNLAVKHGIEIERRGLSDYVLKVNGNVSPLDVEGFRKNPQTDLWQATGTRNEVRQQIRLSLRESLKDETLWKRSMYRFKFGTLMERKYGIRRCVFFCKATDKFDDWKDNKRTAFDKIIAKRILSSTSGVISIAMGCILSADCADYDSDNTDNERRDKLQTKVKDYLEQTGRSHLTGKVDDIVAAVADIDSDGLTNYIIKKLTNETTARIAAKGIPIIGWIDTGATIINFAKGAGASIRRWRYVILAAQAVPLYMLYRSHADEIKNGTVDPELMGSVVNTLGEFAGTPENTGQPAETSPLYSEYFGNPNAKTTSFNPFAPQTAFAQTPTSKLPPEAYECDDGNKVPAGKKICPEEDFRTDNILTDISGAFNQPPLNILGGTAELWASTAGRVLGFLGGLLGDAADFALSHNPLFSGAYNAAKAVQDKIGEKLMEWVAKFVFKTPVSDKMTGARAFSQAAAGANVAGNEFAHYGLGGKLVSPAQIQQSRDYQQELEQYEFSNKSMFARMFDKESSKSLINRLALATPSSLTGFGQMSFANLFSNPLGKIGSTLLPFANNTVSAQVCPGTQRLDASKTRCEFVEDEFGIPQFGYDLNDPIFDTDPETLTDSVCEQQTKAWKDDVKLDEKTGTDVHTKVNQCLLLGAAVTSAGATYDDSVIEEKDRLNAQTAATDEVTNPLPPVTGTSTGIVGDIGESSDSVPCAPNTTDLGVVQSRYRGERVKSNPFMMRLCQIKDLPGVGHDTRGRSINGGAVVNSRVSGAWAGLAAQAKADGVKLESSSSFRLPDSCGGTGDGSGCAKPGTSPHQLGIAVDFSDMGYPNKGTSTSSCTGRKRLPHLPNWAWMFKNAERWGIEQYTYEGWHWDLLGTANRCNSSE